MWKFKSWKGKDKWLFLMTIGVILCILAFPAERIFGTGAQAERKNGSPWTDDAGDSGSRESRERSGSSGNSGSSGSSGSNGNSGSSGNSKNRKSPTGTLTEHLEGNIEGNLEGNLTGNLTGNPEGGEDGAGFGAAYGAFPETQEVSAKAADSYEAELERRIREILKHVDGVGEVDVMVVLESSAEKVWQSDGGTSTSLTEEKDSGGGSRRIENREMEHSTVLLSGDGKSEPMLTKELRPQISGIIISATGGGSPQIQAEISAAMEALFGLPAHKIKVLKRVE